MNMSAFRNVSADLSDWVLGYGNGSAASHVGTMYAIYGD
jgi:hypothetical protein